MLVLEPLAGTCERVADRVRIASALKQHFIDTSVVDSLEYQTLQQQNM